MEKLAVGLLVKRVSCHASARAIAFQRRSPRLRLVAFIAVLLVALQGQSAATGTLPPLSPSSTLVVLLGSPGEGSGPTRVGFVSINGGGVRLGPVLPTGDLLSISVSPNGESLASVILSAPSSASRLETLNLRNGRAATLATASAANSAQVSHLPSSVAWGPNNQLAVADLSGNDIQILSPTGHVVRSISINFAGSPFDGAGVEDWSPNAQQLLLSGINHASANAGIGLYVLDLGTRLVRGLGDDDAVSAAQWSPNGRTIAYEQTTDASTMTSVLKTIGIQAPVGRAIAGPAQYGGVAWAPNGRQLAYLNQTDSDSPSLVVSSQNGSGARTLPSGRVPQGLEVVSLLAWR